MSDDDAREKWEELYKAAYKNHVTLASNNLGRSWGENHDTLDVLNDAIDLANDLNDETALMAASSETVLAVWEVAKSSLRLALKHANSKDPRVQFTASRLMMASLRLMTTVESVAEKRGITLTGGREFKSDIMKELESAPIWTTIGTEDAPSRR